MLTLKELCKPRPIIFDAQKRDTVLDLSDLIAGRVDPRAFFEENYITEGMKTLLQQTFRRLEGKSEQGVFKLKQAMGGGKTHNLLALGLLARHPEYRQEVMGSFYDPDPRLGEVKVIAFSGRETDAPYGIWGALAEQLGKKDYFRDLYSPLQAPGQKAWERLLEGERVLILLDELPPYFQSTRAIAIGNSDLAQVTATALSNLLVAIGRPGCEHVALVLTDLAGAYEAGSAQIAEIIHDFENETRRTAMTLEPVRLNSDELYFILRKRLFEELPHEDQIRQIAQAYAEAIRKARQMDLISDSPEGFAERIMASYPFHPGIRDLYARFRENPGFQQTRGLIRLMRIVAANLWNTGDAERQMLIAAHDLDLNDQQIRAEVAQINSTLENAIAHDIAADGDAVAERLDADYGNRDASDAAKLLLVSSLANVPNAVLGLAIPEVIAYLAAPGRDVARLQEDVLRALATQAWYLHSTRDGKLYFRNVQNLNAKMESLVRTYVEEQAVKELREWLNKLFQPLRRDVYQKVLIFPALDEIELEQDRITLVVVRPQAGGLSAELGQFYEQTTYKNRLAILTGTRDTYHHLLDVGKRLRAIQHIQDDLRNSGTPDTDPQMQQARSLFDRIIQMFHSAVRETFTTLWYPTGEGLMSADFLMKFEGNRYDGEEQIRQVLKEKVKYIEEVSGEAFRKRCEMRLFTQPSMPWNEIKRRAAMDPIWPWHIPNALDALKAESLHQGFWREQDGFVEKGPFPEPSTSLTIREISRNDETGEVHLRVTPIRGDQIYWQEGREVSTASARLEGSDLRTSALRLAFLCVDSTGRHETGEPVVWENRITLKYRVFQQDNEPMMELRAAPPAHIRYTTDGSNPRNGALYTGPFAIPRGAQLVLACAECEGIASDVLRVDKASWEREGDLTIDDRLPYALSRQHKTDSTQKTYVFLEVLEKHSGELFGPLVLISAEGAVQEWVQVDFSEDKRLKPAHIRELLEVLRRIQAEGQVTLECKRLYFSSGRDLMDWAADCKVVLHPNEVKRV